ncbi:MAG: hypothetical protein EBX35_15220 [Planctomycetia bacterium]|nr:hypothetical protein [Planctomycetia bacterium]
MPDLFAAQDRVIHNAMTAHSTARLARQVAHAAASFEHRLLGRSPGSIMVATAAGCLTVCIHEPLAPVERRLAHDGVRPAGEGASVIFRRIPQIAVTVARATSKRSMPCHGARPVASSVQRPSIRLWISARGPSTVRTTRAR